MHSVMCCIYFLTHGQQHLLLAGDTSTWLLEAGQEEQTYQLLANLDSNAILPFMSMVKSLQQNVFLKGFCEMLFFFV